MTASGRPATLCRSIYWYRFQPQMQLVSNLNLLLSQSGWSKKIANFEERFSCSFLTCGCRMPGAWQVDHLLRGVLPYMVCVWRLRLSIKFAFKWPYDDCILPHGPFWRGGHVESTENKNLCSYTSKFVLKFSLRGETCKIFCFLYKMEGCEKGPLDTEIGQ